MSTLETIKTIAELAQKGMNVELQEKIAELREEVISLKEEHVQLREENLVLKQELERYTKGERCPKCRKATWQLINSRPHPMMKDAGVLEREYRCSECGFSETVAYSSD